MSEEKPLAPTEKRIRDARKKGQVPYSRDAVSLVLLLTVFEVLFACVRPFMDSMQALIQAAIISGGQAFAPAAKRLVFDALWICGEAVGLVLLVALLAGLVTGWATVGLVYAPEALKKGMERLNPGNNLKNLFSPAILVKLALALFTLLVVVFICYHFIVQILGNVIELACGTLYYNGEQLLSMLRLLLHTLLASLLVFALFDVWFKRKDLQKHLRMDHQEMRREMKESMGSPEFKAAFRQRQIEAANEPVRSGRTANAVVSNPEHYAVSLFFEAGTVPLPVVVEKGMDAAAERIMACARVEGIPVIRFRPLARMLYARGKIDAPIPKACFKAVALLYRVVQELQAGNLDADDSLEIDAAIWDGPTEYGQRNWRP